MVTTHEATANEYREAMTEWRVEGPFVPADLHRRAVGALQAIYDRHHMVGDGSAGQVSGDALRALGIDPDLGGQS